MLSARAHTWIRLTALAVLVALTLLPRAARHEPVAQSAEASRATAR